MNTFKFAGQAISHAQDGQNNGARLLSRILSQRSTPDQASLTGITFLEQEPGLASEARLPEYMRII